VMMVAAMNPCRCGYWGSKIRECVCTPTSVQMYRHRISGPLLDRIDIQIEVPPVPYSDLVALKEGDSSEPQGRSRGLEGLRSECRCDLTMALKCDVDTFEQMLVCRRTRES